jgi:hypothetical protein
MSKGVNKISWWNLSANANAFHLLEKHLNKVSWDCLSENPNAIHLFIFQSKCYSYFREKSRQS